MLTRIRPCLSTFLLSLLLIITLGLDRSAHAGKVCYVVHSGDPPTCTSAGSNAKAALLGAAAAHSVALWGLGPQSCSILGDETRTTGAGCEFVSSGFHCNEYGTGGLTCGSLANLICDPDEYVSATGCSPLPNLKRKVDCTTGAETPNPISLYSANKVLDVVDFTTGGSLPFELRRFHNSNAHFSHTDLAASRFGPTWKSQFDSRVRLTGSLLEFVFPSGQLISFIKPRFQLWQLARPYQSLRGKLAWLGGGKGLNASILFSDENPGDGVTDDTVTMTDSNDLKRAYSLPSGNLKRIEYRGGYVQTLNYTGSQNTSVTDNLGRTMSFTYDSDDYVDTITATDGSTYKYVFADIVYPLVAAVTDKKLTTVILPDSTPGTDIDNPTIVYHYEDATMPLSITGITDERGVRYATYEYNSDGSAITSEHAGGVDRHSVVYEDPVGSGDTYKSRVTNPLGKETVYHFELYQNVKRLVEVEGKSSTNCVASDETVAYDSNNFINQRTDAEGRITKLTNNTRGLPTQIIEGFGTPEARTTNVTWHVDYNLPTQIAGPGKTTDLVYDTEGRVTSRTETDTTTHVVPYVTTGQTRVWTYTYTAQGLLLSVDGPLAGTGDTQSWTYDANGYVATSTNELSHVTTVVSVNGRGLPLTVRDANSIDTAMTYDERGRLLTVTRASGTGAAATTTLEYDDHGQVTKITRPDTTWLAYTYNDARRLTEIADKLGDKLTYTYDLMGNITQTQRKFAGGTLSYTLAQTYDELGRVLSSIGVNTATTSYAWDRTHNLATVTDPRTGVYAYIYDAISRLISETDQDSDVVSYGLDGQDNVTSYTDPRSLVTTYVRNGFGEIIHEVNPDSGTTTYVRDARGLVTQMTDARSIVTDYTYDAAGRMATKSFPASSGENVTYTWDSIAAGNKGKGRLTSFTDESGSATRTYDERGNITVDTRTISANSYQVAYSYDEADQISQIMFPSGRVVTYTRGDTGHVTDVTTAASIGGSAVDIATSIVRFPHAGIIKSFDYGNALSQLNTVNQDHALDTLSVMDGVTTVLLRTHARANKLNLTGITDGLTPANNQSFAYDADGDMLTASGPWGAVTFLHDGVGNRSSRALAVGGSTTTEAYTYPISSNVISGVDIGGVVTRTFTHDLAGNMTQDLRGADLYGFTYNHAGRMATASRNGALEATYTYTADNQLAIRAMVGANPIHYVHDRQGNVLAEIDGTNGTTLREYIWQPDDEIAPTRETSGTPVARPLAVVDTSGGSSTLHMVHVDHLNRPAMMTDATKSQVWNAAFLPFGGVHSITGTATLDARLPGQWFQLETGHAYNWHRQYDPSIGRYTQADPLGFPDGPNRYAYAMNSPQMYVDKDGRDIAIVVGAPTGTGFPGSGGNPFGHVGVGIEGQGTYSFGTGTQGGSSFTNYLNRQSGYRSSTIFILPTDTKTEQCVSSKLKNYTDNLPGVPSAAALADNCSTRTADALAACGVKIPQFSLPAGFVPWALQNGLNWSTAKQGSKAPTKFQKFNP